MTNFPKKVKIDPSSDLVFKSIQSEYNGIKILYKDSRSFYLTYPINFARFKVDKHKLILIGGSWDRNLERFSFKNKDLDLIKSLYPKAASSLNDTRTYSTPTEIEDNLANVIMYNPIFEDNGKGWTIVTNITENEFKTKFERLDKAVSKQNGRWSNSNNGRWIITSDTDEVRRFNSVITRVVTAPILFNPDGHIIESNPDYYLITNVSQNDYLQEFSKLKNSRWSASRKGRLVLKSDLSKVEKFIMKAKQVTIKTGKGKSYFVSGTSKKDKSKMKTLGGRWYRNFQAWSISESKLEEFHRLFPNAINHID